MYSVDFAHNLVLKSEFIPASVLRPHEQVVEDRMETLKRYLETLHPYVVVPSILACKDTNLIIDGHHRFYALQALGFERMPVTWINYYSDKIITDLGPDPISKERIEEAAATGVMLEPKTSFHHFLDSAGQPQPLILLSVLFRL